MSLWSCPVHLVSNARCCNRASRAELDPVRVAATSAMPLDEAVKLARRVVDSHREVRPNTGMVLRVLNAKQQVEVLDTLTTEVSRLTSALAQAQQENALADADDDALGDLDDAQRLLVRLADAHLSGERLPELTADEHAILARARDAVRDTDDLIARGMKVAADVFDAARSRRDA